MSLTRRLILAIACLAMLPMVSLAEFQEPANAEEWMDVLGKMESDRLDRVETYVERLKGGQIPGLSEALGQDGPKCTSSCRTYKVEDVVIGDMVERRFSRLLSPMEAYALAGVSPETAEMAGMSVGMQYAQDAFAANATQMLGPWAGIATVLLGEVPDSEQVAEDIDNRTWEQDERETPWLNPFRMFGTGSYMFAEAARASAAADASLAQSGSTAQAEVNMAMAFVLNAVMVGIESFDGTPAMLIRAPIPEEAAQQFAAQSADEPGQPSFVPHTMQMWIDTQNYVLLKHRMDGIASMDGESREFFIENSNLDYRQVPGSDMYMPYKRISRMGGVLDDKQKAELVEAQKQLEEFDKQLAAMPPEQRKMVEGMMGSQMESLRSMATTGAFEHAEEIDEILVNPDLKVLFTGGLQAPNPANLLQQIQQHLATLGYAPGNTNGIQDTMTQVAISQYQAEQGITVTGEPSTPLLDALINTVANQ